MDYVDNLKARRRNYIKLLQTCSIEHVTLVASIIRQLTTQIKAVQKLDTAILNLRDTMGANK